MMDWWESLRDQLKVEVSTDVSQVTGVQLYCHK